MPSAILLSPSNSSRPHPCPRPVQDAIGTVAHAPPHSQIVARRLRLWPGGGRLGGGNLLPEKGCQDGVALRRRGEAVAGGGVWVAGGGGGGKGNQNVAL